jgi:hypothetical protein
MTNNLEGLILPIYMGEHKVLTGYTYQYSYITYIHVHRYICICNINIYIYIYREMYTYICIYIHPMKCEGIITSNLEELILPVFKNSINIYMYVNIYLYINIHI